MVWSAIWSCISFFLLVALSEISALGLVIRLLLSLLGLHLIQLSGSLSFLKILAISMHPNVFLLYYIYVFFILDLEWISKALLPILLNEIDL